MPGLSETHEGADSSAGPAVRELPRGDLPGVPVRHDLSEGSRQTAAEVNPPDRPQLTAPRQHSSSTAHPTALDTHANIQRKMH
eukprot:COSAG06_NODE_30785_length_532_cov_1.099307_1_plen_82_part_10